MGRPRSFDMGSVLAQAVLVFRQRGYDGTSIDHLKDATGLTAGSLYKAFANKKQVFAAAFAHYVGTRRTLLSERLDGALSGRERIAETLRFYLDSASGSEGRQGCLVLGSLVETTILDPSLQAAVRTTLNESREALILLLRDGQKDGSIRGDLSVEPCADLLLSLLQGFRAIGKLHDLADHDALIAITLKTLD